MNQWLDKFSLIIITLWIGALWAVGVAAYVLFDTLDDKRLAGQLAGEFFKIVSYVGLISATYLLIHRLLRFGSQAFKQGFFWAVLAMLLLVLAGHYGIQPLLAQLKADAMPSDVMQSVFADRFKTCHGVSSMAYVMQCLLGFIVVIRGR